MTERVLPTEPLTTLDAFADRGGLEALVRANQLGPAATIAELEQAGLRGRGGAGFPTARKWATVRDARGTRTFVVVNGAEGEPGTFKDRTILRRDPYSVVMGAVIAATTVGAHDIYIGVKASFGTECDAVERAVREMADAHLLEGLDVTIAAGPTSISSAKRRHCSKSSRGTIPCRASCRRSSTASSRPRRNSGGRQRRPNPASRAATAPTRRS